MKRLCLGVIALVLLSAAFVRADKIYPCGTFISAEPDGHGGIKINDPVRMQCAPSEEMVVAFVNKDTAHAYRFQIRNVHCKTGQDKGDPTAKFVKKPIDVDAGATKILKSGLFGSSPAMLDTDNLKLRICDDGTYLYKYVIRVSAKGDDENGKVEYDPDLEVSPPPGIETKGARRR